MDKSLLIDLDEPRFEDGKEFFIAGVRPLRLRTSSLTNEAFPTSGSGLSPTSATYRAKMGLKRTASVATRIIPEVSNTLPASGSGNFAGYRKDLQRSELALNATRSSAIPHTYQCSGVRTTRSGISGCLRQASILTDCRASNVTTRTSTQRQAPGTEVWMPVR